MPLYPSARHCMRLHVCVIASLSLSVSLSPSVSLLLTVSLSCSLSLFLLPPRRSFSLSLPQYHCLPSLLSVPVSVTFTLPVYLFVNVTHTFTLPTHHFASMPESLSVSLSLSLSLSLYASVALTRYLVYMYRRPPRTDSLHRTCTSAADDMSCVVTFRSSHRRIRRNLR